MIDRAANNTTETDCPQCGAPVAMPEYADVAICPFCGSTLARERMLSPVRHAADTPGSPAVAPVRPAKTPPDQRTALEEEVLRSVQCSQCAGPLSAREGRRILVCGHCGVRVAVKERGGVSRWYFPVRVDRLGAAAAGAAWLREYPGIARQARDARFVDARLIYAPVWEHRVLLAGWEFGHKLRTRTELVAPATSLVSARGVQGDGERLELRLVREGVKEPRLQERRLYQAATDFEVFGATRPRVTGRELLLPLLAGELDPSATVLEAEGNGSEVAELGRRSALQPLSGAVSPDSHLFTFRERTSLLYYPLWLVRYQTGDRSCRIVVDGRDGTVNSANAPADNRRRLAHLTAQVAVSVIVVALLVWLAVTREGARATMVAAAVIVSVIATLLTSRFRMVGEVEYHEPFSG